MTGRFELKLRSHISTIAILGVMMAISLPRQGGFWALMFFTFAFLFYGVKLTYRLVMKKSVKIQLINVSLWIVVVSLIGCRHVILASETERAALKVSKGIEEYYSTKGEYPIFLNQIGVSNVANEYRITYGIRNGTPLLVYPVTWKYFDAYTYNFEKKVWEYQAE